MNNDNSDIVRHVRHVVGIATLRRLRRMVDHENANEAQAATQAKWLGVAIAAAAVICSAVFAINLIMH